jgi:putative restriction endonuclease
MQGQAQDTAMRMLAFHQVQRMVSEAGEVSARQLKDGFLFENVRIPFCGPQRGIWKPKSMRWLLSIRTVVPKPRGRVWYDDQRDAHASFAAANDVIDYAFQGTNPDAFDNRCLREAMEQQIPILYFVGTEPGKYLAIVGAYIVGFDRARLKAQVAFSAAAAPALNVAPAEAERRYAMRMQSQRLHQATFRNMVLEAYDSRCAFSGVPEAMLLDAAHIIKDKDAEFGQPVVTNGLTLTKLHHAAFDKKLIGVDENYCIHVAPRLLTVKDGPTLEALKALNGKPLRLPRRNCDRPDQDRLRLSFRDFSQAV